MRRILLVLALGGCAPAESAPLSTETDSAGVRIVTSNAPAAEWSLTAEPEAAIGEGDGVELFQVRAISFVPGDRIAVANGGSESIRFFTTGGDLMGEVGRAGAGPDEFNFLSWLAVVGDSLLTYDDRNDRVSVRDLSGGFGRSFRLESTSARLTPTLASVYGILAIGTRGMTELQPGLLLDSALISRHDLTGALVDSVARVPYVQRYAIGGFVGLLPYAAFASIVRAPEGLCYAYGAEAQITCLRDDGSVGRLARTAAAPRPITPAHADEYWVRELALAGENGMRKATLNLMRERGIPFPDAFPAFRKLLVDDAGRVWAEVYPLPDADRVEWRVLDDGHWTGRVFVDPAFQVMAVSGDRIVGVWRDALSVESVRIYRIDTQAN